MKSIGELFLKLLPLLIILWGGYNSFLNIEEIQEQIDASNDELMTLEASINQQRVRNKRIIEFKKNVEGSKARIDDIKVQIQKIQRQLPNSISDTENLDLFSKEADIVNIKNIFLSPLKEYARGFYFAKQYELKGAATFLQCLIFIERLGANERLLNITSLTLTQSEEKSKGRFKLLDMVAVVESFRYNKEFINESKSESESETETSEGFLN